KQVAPALVVSNTGIIHSTREQVSKVDLFRKRNEAEFQRIFDDYGQVHKQALNALGSGDFDKIGMLMSRNQQLLRDIGVSHPRAEEIIEIAIREGAYGAKVTGSGGGGAVIALAQDPQSGRRIAEKLRVAGYESFASTIDPSGVILT
ncbi:MAG TPA: hypothetical protein VFA15_00265, partial [Nitrososphaera sp.]|nr:hypothetical protein [Nitrososphaera sp.]